MTTMALILKVFGNIKLQQLLPLLYKDELENRAEGQAQKVGARVQGLGTVEVQPELALLYMDKLRLLLVG